MWSMKETRAAAAKGDKVPPTYFNVTDSSLELLAPLPPPPHRPQSHPHNFVFSLNTAGSNRLLFSCPAEDNIARWATSLRLAAWERARLEEIYTGHLIKAGGREPKMELQKGRMDGWVRVRVMGGTEWKRLWAVLSTPNPPQEREEEKKNRRKSFFGIGGGGGSGKDGEEVIQEPNTGVPMASFYTEPRTAKNRAMPAVLTISNVTQAYDLPVVAGGWKLTKQICGLSRTTRIYLAVESVQDRGQDRRRTGRD
jgi:CCR4-NOT transcriptional complex subunit CAF120